MTSRASSPAPKIIRHHIGLPRGCLEDVRELLADLDISVVVRDERYAGKPLDVAFHGELRPEQKAAARRDAGPRHRRPVRHDRLRQDRGCRVADRPARRQHAGSRASPPVAGTMGRSDCRRFSACRRRPSAGLAAARRKPTGSLDVAVIQSLVRKGVVKDLRRRIRSSRRG